MYIISTCRSLNPHISSTVHVAALAIRSTTLLPSTSLLTLVDIKALIVDFSPCDLIWSRPQSSSPSLDIEYKHDELCKNLSMSFPLRIFSVLFVWLQLYLQDADMTIHESLTGKPRLPKGLKELETGLVWLSEEENDVMNAGLNYILDGAYAVRVYDVGVGGPVYFQHSMPNDGKSMPPIALLLNASNILGDERFNILPRICDDMLAADAAHRVTYAYLRLNFDGDVDAVLTVLNSLNCFQNLERLVVEDRTPSSPVGYKVQRQDHITVFESLKNFELINFDASITLQRDFQGNIMAFISPTYSRAVMNKRSAAILKQSKKLALLAIPLQPFDDNAEPCQSFVTKILKSKNEHGFLDVEEMSIYHDQAQCPLAEYSKFNIETTESMRLYGGAHHVPMRDNADQPIVYRNLRSISSESKCLFVDTPNLVHTVFPVLRDHENLLRSADNVDEWRQIYGATLRYHGALLPVNKADVLPASLAAEGIMQFLHPEIAYIMMYSDTRTPEFVKVQPDMAYFCIGASKIQVMGMAMTLFTSEMLNDFVEAFSPQEMVLEFPHPKSMLIVPKGDILRVYDINGSILTFNGRSDIDLFQFSCTRK